MKIAHAATPARKTTARNNARKTLPVREPELLLRLPLRLAIQMLLTLQELETLMGIPRTLFF